MKNKDGLLGAMTGNVSDPFCDVYLQDLRDNTTSQVAAFKVGTVWHKQPNGW
jgi:hypothetical protein